MKKRTSLGAFVRARSLRREATDTERTLWRILANRQLEGCKFRRQVPIGSYIADFVCHEAGLIIELDGGQHDLTSSREVARTAFLKSQGYRVIRFWNNEVLENLEGVVDTIIEALGKNIPSPRSLRSRPSPIKGEGKT